MNKDRMLEWAAFLDKVPEHSFDMGHYGVSEKPMEGEALCATAACALGWATAIPEFAEAGLELRAKRGQSVANVYFNGLRDETACAKFFDISDRQACEITLRDWGHTPRMKAERIREMVAESESTL